MDTASFRILIGTIYGAAALACVLLNSIIVLALVKDPLKKLRKLFNFLVIHLCFCDLAAGLFSFPLTCYGLFLWQNKEPTSHKGGILNPDNFNQILDIGTLIATPIVNCSVLATIFLSYDRYKAITQPMQYRQNASLKRFLCYIGIAWPSALIISFSAIVLSNKITLVIFNLTISLIQIIFRAVMYYRVRKVFKGRVNNAVVENLLSSSTSMTGNDTVVTTRLEKNKRAVSTISLIFFMQLLVFMIINSQIVISYFDKSTVHKKTFLIIYLFAPLNGIYNPLVCMLRMTDFKDSIKAMFSCRKTRDTGT